MARTWGDNNALSEQPGGIFNRMTNTPVRQPTPNQPPPNQPAPTPAPSNSPVRDDNYYKHDMWEEIQRETRKPKWWQMHAPTETYQGNGRYGALDEATMNQHGLTSEWRDEEQSQSYGEGGTVDKYTAGNYLTPDSVAKYTGIVDAHNQKMGDAPESKYFGKEWRAVTADDKYKVLDPKAVVWDDNLGWITHKKNYNPDGDKSWFQRNASSIIPAIMGMALGGPAGTAISLGMAGVRAASGQSDWRSLLPAIIGAGMNFGGVNSMLTNSLGRFGGNLAQQGIRMGTGQIINRTRGRRG